jgi:outer membrane protein OmpA-like peptidoglycan-associated protein
MNIFGGNRPRLSGLVLCLAAIPLVALAADLPGSRDPSGLKRFQGSDIIAYATIPYDQYVMARGPGSPVTGFVKSEAVEGGITRVIYRVASGHSALEVLRNYEQMVKAMGLSPTYELSPCGGLNFSGYFVNRFYYQNATPTDADGPRPFAEATNECYFTAKGALNGRLLNVAVFVDENGSDWQWRRASTASSVALHRGDILVGVDVVTANAMQNQMVVVKAADMADALATKGFIDLYGVYFNTDSAALKPQSGPTLDEIASLLKIDRSLKLEISGHTDSTGAKDHNMKLSEARARSVTASLVSKYGIDARRLTAKGYGDTRPIASNRTEGGRAKNRRVELKKI